MKNILGVSQIISTKNLTSSNMPFEEIFFDIAACVGVVEYFTLDYAKLIIKEIYRVLKKGGRCYIDIPNINHKASSLMKK